MKKFLLALCSCVSISIGAQNVLGTFPAVRATMPNTNASLSSTPPPSDATLLTLNSTHPTAPASANEYTTEQIDENGIIMSPAAGEERTYTRVGMTLMYTNEEFTVIDQQGGLLLVECANGTVYMKQPVAGYGLGLAGDSWIKGQRDGHKLIFPGDQIVNFVTMFGLDAAVTICHGTYSSTAEHKYVADRTAPIVFTESEDGSQLFLEGTDQQHVVGAFWDDGDFACRGDFGTELVLDANAFEESLVTPPDGLTTEYYILEGTDYRTGEKLLLDTELGIDGNVAYLTGFSTTLTESWIQGRVENGHIIFPAAQFIGRDAGTDLFVYGGYLQEGGVAISDFYLTYNTQKKRYTASTGLLVTRGKVTSTVVLAEYLSGISLYKPEDGATTPVEIMYDIPEGQLTKYSRFGGSYYTFYGYILEGRQEGKQIDIVTAPDGKTIYMMNPISQGATEPGAWIKGYKDDDGRIHMPLGQYTYQDPDTGTAMETAVLRLTVSGDPLSPILNFVYDSSFTEVTFSVSADGSLTLDPLSDEIIYEGYPSACYGLIYDDDLTWTGYGDYDTRYVPFTSDVTTIPAHLTPSKWAYMYNDGTNDLAEDVMVALDGDRIYVAGLNHNNPSAAIVGNIADGRVTFESDQYVGNSEYDRFLYFVGATYTNNEAYDEEFDYHYTYRTYEYQPTLVFDYDAAASRLTTSGDVCLLINQGIGSTGQFAPVSVGLQPEFVGFEEHAATPASPSVLDYGVYYDDYGYDVAEFFVPTKDVDGNYITTDKLYYIVWTRLRAETLPLVLDPDIYEGLDRTITEIPYNLTVTNTSGWSSVISGGKRVMLFETGYDDIGIQSVYYGAGVRATSPIIWWSGTDSDDSIHSITLSENTREHFKLPTYNISGQRLSRAARGLSITNGKIYFVR